MKIKYLKIRNIASIESGDIDFENGLIDSESGKPSSLFLITGDTGSGKSVILDCISMALYGTTPRVKGVNGIKNNSYTNNEGEEISVNDIRQYTRIGIHWKDKCYSELTFIGNDGIEYVSTFFLGRTSHRNYRDPAWNLKIGDNKLIENRKEEIRETIQKAVGLSFEQFSRMAMLAQGQFATFLTGKKEERERILEQLTATDIFSKYGEAISNIYKRTKHDKEVSEKLYEEFGKKILNEETRDTLRKEQEANQQIASTLKTETERLRNRISHTDAVIKAEKDIENLKVENIKLKDIEESQEYRKRSALIDLWDRTESERKLLSEKISVNQRIATDLRTLQELKAEFSLLTDDLSIRKDSADSDTEALEEEQKWIETRNPMRKTFTDSAVTILQINSYLALSKESEIKAKEAIEGKETIKTLAEEIGRQEKDVNEKSIACITCQEKINKKSKERDFLNPSLLRKENERLLEKKLSLTELSALVVKARTEKEETEKAEKEVTGATVSLSELNKAAEKASSDCKKAETELKDAEGRYMTMHLSIDKNFMKLRNKLANEHAANCPLCGQSITEHLKEWETEGYFSGLLSPLEEEKNKLADAYSVAKKASEEAIEKMNTTAGMLKAKEAELKKKKKSLEKTENTVKENIKLLKITEYSNLEEVIENELAKIVAEVRNISDKLAKAEKIQKEIDELINNKEILDKLHKDADNQLQKSIRNLTRKKESVNNSEARVEEIRLEIINLHEAINNSLKGYEDNWQYDALEVAIRLKKDSDEFAARSSRYEKDLQEHDALLKVLNSLTELQTKLSEQLKTIEGEAEGALMLDVRSLEIDNLQKKWNDFLIEVSTAISHKADNESKIGEINGELNEYYQASGISETTLKHLLGSAKEVSEARILQQKHRDDLNKNTTLLSEAEKSIAENLKILNFKNISELENPKELKAILEAKEKQYGEISQHLGVLKERLEADEETRKESEHQRQELEQKSSCFEKWEKMNRYFGGSRFRTLVQSHILRPLLNNANIYLRQITDHYTLTCSDENEQLSILVLDRYHNNEPRSVTVLSGGERFMISLALSLALSAMNRPDLNVDILFIDEGFGTLDAKNLETVLSTLRRLPEINGQTGRRVGVISHREELTEQIPTQIQLHSCGAGRSKIVISNS